MITLDESNALTLLNQSVIDTNNELKAKMKARQSYINLLETKYDAKWDEKSGQFSKNGKEEKVKTK